MIQNAYASWLQTVLDSNEQAFIEHVKQDPQQCDCIQSMEQEPSELDLVSEVSTVWFTVEKESHNTKLNIFKPKQVMDYPIS